MDKDIINTKNEFNGGETAGTMSTQRNENNLNNQQSEQNEQFYYRDVYKKIYQNELSYGGTTDTTSTSSYGTYGSGSYGSGTYGSGSYVNTQNNSDTTQYSQKQFDESLNNSSKYTVVEQYNLNSGNTNSNRRYSENYNTNSNVNYSENYNTNSNVNYNNGANRTTGTYSPYSSPNPNYNTQNQYNTQQNQYNPYNTQNQYNPYNRQNQYNPYNTQNQYNPYNSGGANPNRDSMSRTQMVKANSSRENKRMLLALLAIAIIVFSGFGISKFVSFIISSVTTESSHSIETRIEGKFNIIVNTGENADITEDEMDIEMLTDEEDINKALEYLEEVLERLPEGFIDEVMEGYGTDRYLEINITGKMLRLTDNREVVGLTTYEPNKDVIRLDGSPISWNEYKATVAHEFFHVIDFEMEQFDEKTSYIKSWKASNPTGFGYSYTNGQMTTYTMSENDIDDIYFVSEYSKEDIFEDRAEVFSYLISVDENDKLPRAYKSDHVKKKVDLLIEEMKEHFDSAKEEEAYWNNWGIE